MPIPLRVKYFSLIVYMLISFFSLKAQQPLLFSLSSNTPRKLIETNYITGTEKIINIPVTNKWISGEDHSAFDAFNGRYFYWFTETACDSTASLCIKIIETNVKTGESKIYRPSGGGYDFSDLYYDPFENSLKFTKEYIQSLFSLDLETSNISETTLPIVSKDSGIKANISINANYYNSLSNEYIISYRKKLALDSFLTFYNIVDLKTGQSKLFSKNSPNQSKWFWTSQLVYNIHQDSYFGFNSDSMIVKLTLDSVAVIKKLPRQSYQWSSTGNKYDPERKQYFWFINDTDHQTNFQILDTNFNTLSKYHYNGQYPEIHNFEKPYIRVEENAYRCTYGKSYRWLWNGKPIPNSDEQTHTPSQCGFYSVEVTHLDGRIDTSDAVYKNLDDNDGNPITGDFTVAYPNPFSSQLNIKYKTCREDVVTTKIYNSIGQQVFTNTTQNKIPAGDNELNWNSEIYGLRGGLYFIKIYSGHELLATHKVIRQ